MVIKLASILGTFLLSAASSFSYMDPPLVVNPVSSNTVSTAVAAQNTPPVTPGVRDDIIAPTPKPVITHTVTAQPVRVTATIANDVPTPTVEPSSAPTGPVTLPVFIPESTPTPVPTFTPTPVSTPPIMPIDPRQEVGILGGHAMITSVCPVVRDVDQCQSVPYEGKIVVYNQNSEVVATISSDKTGYFSVSLDPGTYSLRAGGPNTCPDDSCMTQSMPPYGHLENVVVKSGQDTSVTLDMDSGIR